MSTSARAIIVDFLRRYDLSFSTTQVDKWVGMISDSGQTIMPLIDEEIRLSPQFQERFPGLGLRRENGHNQVSVEQYLQLESAYLGVLRAAGLPQEFYDSPSALGQFIANDISPSELEFRVSRGVVAAREAPQEVRDTLEQFYGIRPAESFLAAYFLNPDLSLPLMERRIQAAQIAGLGSRSGFEIGRTAAEEFASLGVATTAQVQSGLQQADRARSLGQETISERGNDITDEDLLGASFGTSSESERRLRERLSARRSQFGGGSGGAGQNQQGTFLGGQR